MRISVAVFDDYALVVAGVARMLEPHQDRINVVEIGANAHPHEHVDVALYDAFGQGEADHDNVSPLLDDPTIDHVAIYTSNFAPELIAAARRRGLSGYLSKSLDSTELVEAIERVAQGSFVLSTHPGSAGRAHSSRDWPGRDLGLTERESEVLALLTQGLATMHIATTMHLSPNTIKTHTKSLYHKLNVNSRSAAILWGIDNGFRPDHFRQRHPHG